MKRPVKFLVPVWNKVYKVPSEDLSDTNKNPSEVLSETTSKTQSQPPRKTHSSPLSESSSEPPSEPPSKQQDPLVRIAACWRVYNGVDCTTNEDMHRIKWKGSMRQKY